MFFSISKVHKFFYPLLNPAAVRMLFLGFSAGIPLLLVFSTLSVWLVKAGVERATITLFSWAGFAYSFKFIWSPLVDNFKLPIIGFLGKRRSWLILSQMMIVISLLFISFTDPKNNLVYTAIGAVLLAFSSATQDIALDAYRIESSSIKMQGSLSSMYLAGYRIGMITSGAGSLWLASIFGSENYNPLTWQKVYWIMALFMGVGILTVINSDEPKHSSNIIKKSFEQIKFFFAFILGIIFFFLTYVNIPEILSIKNVFFNFLNETFKIILSTAALVLIIFLCVKIDLIDKDHAKKGYLDPISNFLKRYKKIAIAILLLIGLYRIADVVLGVIANVFYLEKGFSMNEIATFSKFFGIIATIIGGLIGGLSSVKFGIMRSLFIGALVAALSNLLFAWIANIDANIKILALVITADNIASGFAGATFIVYLSALTSIKFTATQYALFSSLMLFLPKLIAGYAGSFVTLFGYTNFFIFTAILGLPVLVLIFFLGKIIVLRKN